MRSPFGTTTALICGFLAGIGASACCVGPLLLLSLGISGAWISHLTALERYRPLFLLLTFVFIGLVFRRLYLVPQSCDTGEVCLADLTRRTQRLLFWIVAPLVLGLAASPWFLPLLYR
jgi:mercuric ion transport protein